MFSFFRTFSKVIFIIREEPAPLAQQTIKLALSSFAIVHDLLISGFW